MLSERNTRSSAAGMRIGVAVSHYHDEVTSALLAGAVETFVAAGGRESDLLVVRAPGAFELTAVCRALAGHDDLDGVVALGCIIRGDTSHDQHLAQAVANGLTAITVQTGKPVAFGVLTCHTRHQARERAGGERGNKGVEAMTAAIEAIDAIRGLTAASAPGKEPR
jgi:6,7-dimethyl-8-ribityllumazine synthase